MLCRLLPSLIALAATPAAFSQDIPGSTLHEGLVYAEHAGVELALDVLEPARNGAPRAAVMVIHGGGWRQGSRAKPRAVMTMMATHGLVAISPSYRFSADHVWPAQWEDVRAAFDWVRAHAAEYELDPERVAALGMSAGGHLALVAGLRHAPGHRPRARTVINFFGPTELGHSDYSARTTGIITQLLGGPASELPDACRDASPLCWINHGDVSVFSVHGELDPVVPVSQARLLHEALEEAGVPHHLRVDPEGKHGIARKNSTATFAAVGEHIQRELLPSPLPLVAAEDFERDDQAERWTFTDSEAWTRRKAAAPADLPTATPGAEPASDQHVLALTRKESRYSPPVRSPLHQALLNDSEVSDFVLDVWVQSTHPDYGHRDLCLFFGHQSPSRFYYVHLGQQADAHAHSIFLVNEAARVSIAQERTEGTPWDHHWHRVRIERDVASGIVAVYFDDLQTPIMKTVDRTFLHGKVGVGSFDDTGNFDALRLWGRRVP